MVYTIIVASLSYLLLKIGFTLLFWIRALASSIAKLLFSTKTKHLLGDYIWMNNRIGKILHLVEGMTEVDKELAW